MGFDLFGQNPVNPKGLKRPKRPDWSKAVDKEVTDKYFRELNKYQTEVVGSYFRSNVWWWRPLAKIIEVSCKNFLSKKQLKSLHYNDGTLYQEDVALKMAEKIRDFVKSKEGKRYHAFHKRRVKQAIKNNAIIEKKLDALKVKVKKEIGKDVAPINYPQPYRKMWEFINNNKDWHDSYPYTPKHALDFCKFAENSGGFTLN